jgi:hypothetical protein
MMLISDHAHPPLQFRSILFLMIVRSSPADSTTKLIVVEQT